MNAKRMMKALAAFLSLAAVTSRGAAEGPAAGGPAAEGPAAEDRAAPIELSVERAMELASTASGEVRARNAQALAARRAADAAKARLFPSLSGSVSGAYLVNPPEGVTVKAGSLGGPPTLPFLLPPTDMIMVPDTKDTYFKGNLTFTQPIFTWGKIRDGIDLALLEARTADAEARGSALDARKDADKTYFAALLARRSASILEELVGMAEGIVADRQSALDEGLSTKEKLLSSKADLAELRSRLVEAREAEASALEALALLTGLSPDGLVLTSDFRDEDPPADEGALKQAATLASTALDEAGIRLAQARRKLDLERASGIFRPDVSLFASLDASAQGLPFAGSEWSDTATWNLSVGLAAKADFFDGGAAAARAKQAEAGGDAAAAALAAAGKAARLEARRAVEAARKAVAALAAARARAEWSAEALRAAKASADEEIATRAELLGARILEASDRLAVLNARFGLEAALADLDRIAGKAR
jgi:outer membrane protein TolC